MLEAWHYLFPGDLDQSASREARFYFASHFFYLPQPIIFNACLRHRTSLLKPSLMSSYDQQDSDI